MTFLLNLPIKKIIVLIVTFIAFLTDIKTGRIYNKLTFPAILLGWGLAVATGGLTELGYSFFATILAILLYLPFAAFGFVGMGDVKLLAAIGAIMGPTFMVTVFVYTGVLGLFHAIIVQCLNYGKNGFGMLITSLKTGLFLKKNIQNENENQLKYKFLIGIDIFIATVIACFYAFHW